MGRLVSEPWSADELASLRRVRKAMGADFDLEELARRHGRSSADTNRALDVLLGRSAEEAAQFLAAAPGPVPGVWGPGGAIGAHLTEIFG